MSARATEETPTAMGIGAPPSLKPYVFIGIAGGTFREPYKLMRFPEGTPTDPYKTWGFSEGGATFTDPQLVQPSGMNTMSQGVMT